MSIKKPLASTLLLLLISLLLSISTADQNGPRCNCNDDDEEDRFFSIENILECQRISDLLIAAAYFSIPIELLYFVSCSNVPFKWVLFEFIAFIVLCGMTHLLNGWTYGPHSFQLMLALTVFKSLTALVSFATAITLGTLIPLLLKVKVREFMLKKKACDLDREMGLIKKQSEAGLHVRMLTQEIRKSLDRHTILHTTLVELSKTLGLMNCAVWMPSESKTEVNLTHELKNLNSSNVYNLIKKTIPTNDPDVREIERSDRVKILDSDSALAVASGAGGGGSVAAIRMPMLRVSNFKGGAHEMVPECYAILVLVNGHDRNWSDQELEIVEAVADQVAVALSHVSILEESQLMREKLAEQNRALQQAKEDAIMASGARSAFQKGMSNGLRKPMHSIVGLLSLLQDAENLSNEQQLLVDTTVKTGNVLSTLITDNGRLLFPLDIRSFPFHSTVREVACLSKCLCGYRGYDFAVEVDKLLPDRVSGDERRVFQVILHMVGNLLTGGEGGGGFLVLRVSSGGGSKGGWNEQRWGPWRSNSSSDGYAYVRIEVCVRRRSGGFKAAEVVSIVPHEESMSFSACKKLVQLMHGDIWATSNPEGFDKSMALVLRFQIRRSSIITGISSSSDQHGEYSSSDQHSYSILRGLKVILADGNDVNRAVTRKLLEKLGCVVVCAVSSGNECVGALISGGANPVISSCEIVIVDLDLPDLDGYDVAARIRKYRSGSDWPLTVALTASGDGETRERCLRVGMNGFVEKPCSFRDFGCELKRVLMQANRLFVN